MTRILIEEYPGGPNSANARVSFDGGPVYPTTISKPFTPEEEERLVWYFEKYLYFPQLKQVMAQEVSISICSYGEALFNQVFADRRAFAAYVQYRTAGLNTLQFEVAGSSAFHALHWEALKDPELPHPFVLDATMIRKNLTPPALEAHILPSPTINILVVTARPAGRHDVAYRTISRPLVEALRQTDVPIQIDLLRPGTYLALSDRLDAFTNRHGAGFYHVIHFDVHGALLTYEQLQQEREASHFVFQTRPGYDRPDIQPYPGERAFLFLEAEQTGKAEPVAATELARLLLKHQIPVALLNACQSGKMPQIDEDDLSAQHTTPSSSSETRESSLGQHLMLAGIQVVLAMSYSVTVSAARLLMSTLYRHLFDKEPLPVAIRAARMTLANRKARQAAFNRSIDLEDWLLPVVYQNQPVQLDTRSFTSEEEQHYYTQQAHRFPEPLTAYGFVGRDLDILELERCLLLKHNLLLLQGMGGAGKTTLLRHLAAWWQTTHLVEQVYYFGYDERAWTRQQLIRAIAEHMVGKQGYEREYQPLLQEAQQAKLVQRLRATRHLLILDNLESITGINFAILHTLSPKEQTALRDFLRDLAGGKTLVLLGSRGDETWLAPGTFGDNVYTLGGLDPEAAASLSERILERHHATRYRDDTNLRHLLTLLDGFPLALEIVLANLVRQTPAEVLTALQTGNVGLDNPAGRTRTESILQCIEYAHSNLSPDAQHLLLCLAPFTSIFDIDRLTAYTEELAKQSMLATLPFKQWDAVLHETQHWGLLTPDANYPFYLHLHPILPYFLSIRLQQPAEQKRRIAIETAFRSLYKNVGDEYYTYLQNQGPETLSAGLLLVQFEYENMVTALRLALTAHSSIIDPYRALAAYLDQIQEPQRGLALSQMVQSGLQAASPELLTGSFGEELIVVLDRMASFHLELKQFAEAEHLYQRALSVQQELQHIDAQVKKYRSRTLYHQLGRTAQEQRQWEKAEQYYQQSLRLYEEFGDRSGQAITYHRLGMVAQGQGQQKQEEQYYRQALRLFEEINDRSGQAGTCHQLGLVAQGQRQWEQAEQYYRQALRLFEEIHVFEEIHDRYRQAGTYHQLGMVAQEQQQWEQAEQYYQQALRLKEEFHDRYGQALTYGQLGLLAQDQGQLKQAREYNLQALTLFIEYRDEYSTGIIFRNLARLWGISGDISIPAAVSAIMGLQGDKVEQEFRQVVEHV